MNNTAENHNGTVSNERKKSILQRQKEALARKVAESSQKISNEQPKQSGQIHKKQPTCKRVQVNGDNSGFPLTKLTLIKRSSMQEKLFSYNCKKSYATLEEDSSSSDALESKSQSRFHNKRRENRYNQSGHSAPSRTNSQQQFQSQTHNSDIDNENPDDNSKKFSSSSTFPIHNSQHFDDKRRNGNNYDYSNKKSFHSNTSRKQDRTQNHLSEISRHYSSQQINREKTGQNCSTYDENHKFPSSTNHQQQSQNRRSYRRYNSSNEGKKSPNSDALRSNMQKRDKFSSTDEEDKPETNVSMDGVLHVKGPLVNQKNESMYYNDRGRMDFIDWSAVREEGKALKTNKKSYSANNENKTSCVTKIPEVLPEVNSDFSNFVKNTTTCETIYKVRGNTLQLNNAIDSPILKIQRMISNNGKAVIPITREIKQLFKEPEDSVSNLMDIMDLPIQKLILEPLVKTTSDETYKVTKVNDDTICSQSQSINEDTSCKVVSVNKETQKWEEYDDDMFTFQKPKSKRTVSTSSAGSANFAESKIPLSRSTSITSIISQDEKIHELIASKSEIPHLVNYTSSNSINTSSDEKSCSSSSGTKSILDKLKKLKINKKETSNTSIETVNVIETIKQESLNCSLDSDDTSLNKSHEIEKIPISKMTPQECIRKLKLLKTGSAKYLVEKNHINKNINQQKDTKTVKTENDEFALKETSTRYFKKFDNVNLENIVVNKDDSYQEIKLKTYPLLTEIHTRYYKSTEANLKEEVFKEQEFEKEIEKVSKEFEEKKTVKSEVAHCDSENSEHISQIKDTNSHERKFSSADTSITSDKSTSFEKMSEEMKKIDFEKCFTGINLETVFQQVDGNLDTVDEVENDTGTIIVQDIDLRMKEQKEDVILAEINESGEDIPLSDSTIKNSYEYSSNGDPEEEFDIVNLEGFAPFQVLKELKNLRDERNNQISNNLKSIDMYNSNSNSNNNNDNNNNSNDNSKFNLLKLNHIDANELSDVDDEDETITTPITKGTYTKKLSYGASKNEESARRKKMMNVLKSYQKNREPENAKEESEGVASVHETSDAMQNTSSGLLSRHQILEKIKSVKLHLGCKPMIERSAIRL